MAARGRVPGMPAEVGRRALECPEPAIAAQTHPTKSGVEARARLVV
jgi:hypothetical protein